MSVLIKGMKMPENCRECKIKAWKERYNVYVCPFGGILELSCLANGRRDECLLVELPEKHGRLIDADAFAELIENTIERQNYKNVTIDGTLTIADVLTAVIDDLKGNTIVKYESNPTVIEAEGKE